MAADVAPSPATERLFEVLVLYHPDDRDSAKQLRSLLTHEKGYTCCLFLDTVASDMNCEIFKRADAADCVISILTEKLFGAADKLAYHRHVYTKLQGKGFLGFVPINVDAPKDVIDSPAAGFLTGCNVLDADWTSEDFRERLMIVLGSIPSRDGTPTKNRSAAGPTSPSSQDAGQTHAMAQAHERSTVASFTADIAPPQGGQDAPVPGRSSLLRRSTSDPGRTKDEPLLTERNAKSALFTDPPTTAADVVAAAPADIPIPIPTEDERIDLDSPGKNRIYKRKYRMADGRVTAVVRKQLLSHADTQEWLRRTKATKFLRSPFIIPTLAVEQIPEKSAYIITPFMLNGNLENLLNPEFESSDKTALFREGDANFQLVRIFYQISAAVDFLHSQGIVHGNINPGKVLVSCHGNARLGDFRQSFWRKAGESNDRLTDGQFEARRGYGDPCGDGASFESDIFAFGTMVLQLLKWHSSTEGDPTPFQRLQKDYKRLVKHYDDKLPEVGEMVSDGRYVEAKLWKDDRITKLLCQVAVKSLRLPATERIKAAEVKERLMKCMTMLGPHVPQIKFRDKTLCVYCKVDKLNPDLQAESSGCSGRCVFLQICPSCMQLAGRNNFTCPDHDCRIRSPIGGERACALIVTGSDDDDKDTHETFQEDCRMMSLVASHPSVFAIPRRNVYQIAPFVNSGEADIRRVLEAIADKRPHSCLIYFSGHPSIDADRKRLIVSSEQGSMLDVDQLQRYLLAPLARYTSQILVILDCCNAAAMKLLPELHEGEDDGHVAWHIEWPSCGRRENSNIELGHTNSVFTKYLLSGLTGASRCPSHARRKSGSSCAVCTEFRTEYSKTRYINVNALGKYVSGHMRLRPQDGRDDTQRPIMIRKSRKEPIIAYIAQRPLYRFHYVPLSSSVKHVCNVNYIGFDIDDVLQLVWNTLKAQHIPQHLDHHTLEIYQSLDGRRVSKRLHCPDDIIDAVHEDDDSLFVTIRTDGTELNADRWVACFCDSSAATESVRCLHLESSKKDCPVVESEVKTLHLTDLDKDWIPKEDNEFDKVLMTCWRTFSELEQNKGHAANQQDIAEMCLHVEIRDKLSMFSIKQLPEHAQETQLKNTQ